MENKNPRQDIENLIILRNKLNKKLVIFTSELERIKKDLQSINKEIDRRKNG